MSKLTLLLVGLVAGWIAKQIMGRDQTLLMNLVLGTRVLFLAAFSRPASSMCAIPRGSILRPSRLRQAAPCCCWPSRKVSIGPAVSDACLRS